MVLSSAEPSPAATTASWDVDWTTAMMQLSVLTALSATDFGASSGGTNADGVPREPEDTNAWFLLYAENGSGRVATTEAAALPAAGEGIGPGWPGAHGDPDFYVI